MLRSRRWLACSAISRCRNCRCDKPSRSARARMASNAAAASGTLRAAKSARMRSRRSVGGVGIVVGFFGGGTGGRGVLRRGMIGRVLSESAIFRGWSRRHRVVTQMLRQTSAFAIGQGVEAALRLGLGREDAFDGVERIGAEAHGPFESRQEIDTGIGALQSERLECLALAVTLIAQQAVEEAL